MRAVNELGIPMKKNVRLILGTDEECGSSDITHYYSVEKEAPMTFSPDASFPVINIEKGRIGGNFTAEFEPSDRLPKMVSFHSGTKTNVVPGAAEALFEGLDGDETEALAKSMEEELGIQFTVFSEDGCNWRKRPCNGTVERKECPDRTLIPDRASSVGGMRTGKGSPGVKPPDAAR